MTSDDLSTEAKILAAYLARYCRGRAQARPQHVIRGHLAAAGCRVSARAFFDVEAELVAGGVPLGTSDKGVYLCADDEDFSLAYHYLVTRFKPMRDRAVALDRMREARAGAGAAQGTLFDAYGML